MVLLMMRKWIKDPIPGILMSETTVEPTYWNKESWGIYFHGRTLIDPDFQSNVDCLDSKLYSLSFSDLKKSRFWYRMLSYCVLVAILGRGSMTKPILEGETELYFYFNHPC